MQISGAELEKDAREAKGKRTRISKAALARKKAELAARKKVAKGKR